MKNLDERSCYNSDDQPLKLKPNQIQLNVEASDWEEAIKIACEPLIVDGSIDKSYIKNVIDRERRWPTGLPTQPIAVAIPHAETGENIKKSAVAVAVLKESVKFHESGGGAGNFVDVKIVFVLAINDSARHLKVLRQLMNVFSNSKKLDALIAANTNEEFAALFNGFEE